jgi:glycosyltransferase involved in cell wall biosynthesis
MRILLVSARGADLDFGGAERYVDLLRDGLARHGHAVTVLAAFPARADGSPARINRHRSDPLSDPVRRIRDRVDGFTAAVPGDLDAALADVDLVHTNNLPGIGSGIWELARRRGIPVVHTLHDYGLLCARSSLRRRDGSPCRPHPLLCGLRTRRLARWAAGVRVVIAVSDHVRRRHADLFTAGTVTALIAPPRIVTAGAEPGERASALTRLGYVGALTRETGVDVLMGCAPALARRGVSISVAGAGPLEALVRASPVAYAGHLRGAALSRFHAEQDAGIVCSTWEEPAVTFAALEWLGARRPIVVSDRGALTELVGAPGVVSYDASAAGLLDAVGQMQQPDRWSRLTGDLDRAARDDDIERWLTAHLDAYAQARVPRVPFT